MVLLPLPVGPVTTTRPLVSQHRSITFGGSPSFSTGNELERNLTKHRARAVSIDEVVRTKARHALDRVGEVRVPISLELRTVARRA